MRHDEPLPPGLSDFGRQLDDLGARHARRDAARRRRTPRWQLLPGAVLAAVAAAAVAAGATALIDPAGPPITPDGRAPDAVAPLDPSVIASTRTSDPGGELDWALRISSDERGRECLVLGRLQRGRFGQLVDGRFGELPASTPGLCGDRSNDGLVAFTETRTGPARTAVFGITSGARSLEISVAGTRRRVSPAALGAFLTVIKGVDVSERVSVTTTIEGRVVRRVLR